MTNTNRINFLLAEWSMHCWIVQIGTEREKAVWFLDLFIHSKYFFVTHIYQNLKKSGWRERVASSILFIYSFIQFVSSHIWWKICSFFNFINVDVQFNLSHTHYRNPTTFCFWNQFETLRTFFKSQWKKAERGKQINKRETRDLFLNAIHSRKFTW